MIDENKDITESKFTIAKNTLSKYNDRSKVAAKTNRLRDTETDTKTKGHTVLTNRRTSTYKQTHAETSKQKMKIN